VGWRRGPGHGTTGRCSIGPLTETTSAARADCATGSDTTLGNQVIKIESLKIIPTFGLASAGRLEDPAQCNTVGVWGQGCNYYLLCRSVSTKCQRDCQVLSSYLCKYIRSIFSSYALILTYESIKPQLVTLQPPVFPSQALLVKPQRGVDQAVSGNLS
jgi:hypothetical protein